MAGLYTRCFGLMLVAFCYHVPVMAQRTLSAKVDYADVLQRLWRYNPELPRQVLDQGVGIQGDRIRLERAVMKLIRGEPLSVALIGGSISIRGWNHPDEAYSRQVHKWLELTFVPGCREEAESRARLRHSRSTKATASSGGAASGAGSDTDAEAELVDGMLGADGRLGDVGASRGHRAVRAWQRQLLEAAAGSGAGSGADAADGAAAAAAPTAATAANRRQLGDAWAHDPRPEPEQDLHVTTNPKYEESGHMCSSSEINFVSLAVPAAGPGYAERCALQHLPEDVDLVIIDFAVNDYMDGNAMSHPERHAYERIMRRVLGLAHRPAVLLFHAYSWEQSHGMFAGPRDHRACPGILAQDKHSVMAEYYGDVQVLSARAALYQMVATSKEFEKLIFIAKGNDFLHVSLLGHRWYADIIINYLRSVAMDLITRMVAADALPDGAGQLDANLALLQQEEAVTPLTPDASGKCRVFGARTKAFQVNCTASGLPPPFFTDNEVQDSGLCAIGSDFTDVVEEHDGWEWVDEGRNGVHKWGYVSHTPGDKLRIRVRLGSSRGIMAWLIYLQSYEGMGQASVKCMGGCTCTEEVLDSMSKDERIQASVPVLYSFDIRKASAEECVVQVEVLQETSDPKGGTKFKAIGITTSSSPVWHLSEIVTRGNNEWAEKGEGEGDGEQ